VLERSPSNADGEAGVALADRARPGLIPEIVRLILWSDSATTRVHHKLYVSFHPCERYRLA